MQLTPHLLKGNVPTFSKWCILRDRNTRTYFLVKESLIESLFRNKSLLRAYLRELNSGSPYINPSIPIKREDVCSQFFKKIGGPPFGTPADTSTQVPTSYLLSLYMAISPGKSKSIFQLAKEILDEDDDLLLMQLREERVALSDLHNKYALSESKQPTTASPYIPPPKRRGKGRNIRW